MIAALTCSLTSAWVIGVPLTIPSVGDGGSTGGAGVLTAAGVGVRLGFGAAVVRRRGFCATAMAASAIRMIEMKKVRVRFISAKGLCNWQAVRLSTGAA